MLPLVNASPVFEGTPDPSRVGAAAASSSRASGTSKASGSKVASTKAKSVPAAGAAGGGAASRGKQSIPFGQEMPIAAVVAARKAVDETMNAYAMLGE